MHRQNSAEWAIQTCKNNVITGLSTTNPYFPIREWDCLHFQFLIALNLLHNARVNPAILSYDYLYCPFDFNKSSMAPPGTREVFHDKPGNCMSWGHHVTPGWYIGASLDQSRYIQ